MVYVRGLAYSLMHDLAHSPYASSPDWSQSTSSTFPTSPTLVACAPARTTGATGVAGLDDRGVTLADAAALDEPAAVGASLPADATAAEEEEEAAAKEVEADAIPDGTADELRPHAPDPVADEEEEMTGAPPRRFARPPKDGLAEGAATVEERSGVGTRVSTRRRIMTEVLGS